MPIPDHQSITRESRRRKRGMNLVLDIGSGLNPLKEENVIHVDINRLSKHLELVCDAYYLPFQNNKFQIVHASHILEHLENPIKVLEEWKRVTKHLIIIKVPNASFEGYIYESTKEHLFSWTEGTFEHLLNRVFPKVKILRILQYRKPSRGFRHKMQTIKFYLLSLFWKKNDLVGVCQK